MIIHHHTSHRLFRTSNMNWYNVYRYIYIINPIYVYVWYKQKQMIIVTPKKEEKNMITILIGFFNLYPFLGLKKSSTKSVFPAFSQAFPSAPRSTGARLPRFPPLTWIPQCPRRGPPVATAGRPWAHRTSQWRPETCRKAVTVSGWLTTNNHNKWLIS